MKFFNRVRDYRKNFGLTQRDLAQILGVSINTISSIECQHSTPSLIHAYFLCQIFHVSFEDLFYNVDD